MYRIKRYGQCENLNLVVKKFSKFFKYKNKSESKSLG